MKYFQKQAENLKGFWGKVQISFNSIFILLLVSGNRQRRSTSAVGNRHFGTCEIGRMGRCPTGATRRPILIGRRMRQISPIPFEIGRRGRQIFFGSFRTPFSPNSTQKHTRPATGSTGVEERESDAKKGRKVGAMMPRWAPERVDWDMSPTKSMNQIEMRPLAVYLIQFGFCSFFFFKNKKKIIILRHENFLWELPYL